MFFLAYGVPCYKAPQGCQTLHLPGANTMDQVAKIAAIAIVAVIIGKRLPILKDYL